MTTNQPAISLALQAITANLAALDEVLKEAAESAAKGAKFAQEGEQNMAIGNVLHLEDLLAQATALYGAAIALHRKK